MSKHSLRLLQLFISLQLFSCTSVHSWKNQGIWYLNFVKAKFSPDQSLSWQTPIRPIKSTIPSKAVPSYSVVSQVKSVDQHGYHRLQLQVRPGGNLSPQAYKYMFSQIVDAHQNLYDVIWITLLSPNDTNMEIWLARADWFSAQLPPHHRFKISKNQELFRGIQIEYQSNK